MRITCRGMSVLKMGEEVRLLSYQVVQLWRSIANVAHKLENCEINSNTLLCCINHNLSHLVVSPGHCNIGDGNEDTTSRARQEKAIILSNTPQMLHDLWVEWEFGLAGDKPANNATKRELDRKNN